MLSKARFPIAHIYYAHEYAARHHRSDEPAFLRGTVFPDIRYIANIDRSVTHRLDVSLAEIEAEQDDWRAGVLLHCWVDVGWTAYFEQYGLGSEDHAFDGMRTALKLLEDEQLHRLLGPMNVTKLAQGLEAGNEGAGYASTRRPFGFGINWSGSFWFPRTRRLRVSF